MRKGSPGSDQPAQLADDAVAHRERSPSRSQELQLGAEPDHANAGGTERLVGIEKPALISQVSGILLQYYQNDLVSEDTLKSFGSKASKKYVDISTSKKVRKSAEKFIEWLENAESDEDSDEE